MDIIDFILCSPLFLFVCILIIDPVDDAVKMFHRNNGMDQVRLCRTQLVPFGYILCCILCTKMQDASDIVLCHNLYPLLMKNTSMTSVISTAGRPSYFFPLGPQPLRETLLLIILRRIWLARRTLLTSTASFSVFVSSLFAYGT